MPQAQFVQAGEMIDYRPLAAVGAGDVIVLGERVLVAKQSIEPGRLGSLAAAGAFDVAKDASAFQMGAAVYWDSGATPVGNVGLGAAVANEAEGVYMGSALLEASGQAPTVRVLLGASAATGSQGPRIVWDEAPQNLGANLWRLAQTSAPGKLMLFRNGLLQREGATNDFTLAGRDIAFNAGNEPQPGDVLSATYMPL